MGSTKFQAVWKVHCEIVTCEIVRPLTRNYRIIMRYWSAPWDDDGHGDVIAAVMRSGPDPDADGDLRPTSQRYVTPCYDCGCMSANGILVHVWVIAVETSLDVRLCRLQRAGVVFGWVECGFVDVDSRFDAVGSWRNDGFFGRVCSVDWTWYDSR